MDILGLVFWAIHRFSMVKARVRDNRHPEIFSSYPG